LSFEFVLHIDIRDFLAQLGQMRLNLPLAMNFLPHFRHFRSINSGFGGLGFLM
jgi:hypothetical protein